MTVQRLIGSALGVGPEPRSCHAAKAAPAFAAGLARSELVFEGDYPCVYVP